MAAVVALTAGLLAGLASARLPVSAMVRVSHTARPRSGRATPRPTATPAHTATPSPPEGSTATMVTVEAGGLTRTYRVIRPAAPGTARLPALVILHGVNATIDDEEVRDGLLPLAATGQAILVYPVGTGESWNAGVCCPPAVDNDVDDVSFVDAVIQQIAADPGVDPARI